MVEPTAELAAQRITSSGAIPLVDSVAVEEPLVITVNGQPYVTTMRTPGDDINLAKGLLYTDGIIQNSIQITDMHVTEGQVDVTLNIEYDMNVHARSFIRSTSCGVCGRESIDAVLRKEPPIIPRTGFDINREMVDKMLNSLRDLQVTFDITGGVHGIALFSKDGELVELSEDVGRHNAMDKVIGRTLESIPLHHHGFLLSGRVSFEMVQKAVMAGTSVIVAIGAPTTLAVDLARQHGLTLIGFARERRFNVYSGSWRLH